LIARRLLSIPLQASIHWRSSRVNLAEGNAARAIALHARGTIRILGAAGVLRRRRALKITADDDPRAAPS
jgi:hypothetical protein